MAVELRTLRVSADLDASGYARGAGQISAAQELVSRGHRLVGLAAAESDQKVRASVEVHERLARQFVSGYGAAQSFENSLRTLNRALEAGAIDGARAEAIYTGMAGKLGTVANGADLAAQGYRQLGAAVDAANAKMAATPARPMLNVLDPANDNSGRHRRQGLMYQAFDIGTTVAGGMNPGLVLAQQGPQIIQMYAGNGGVNALLKDTAVLAGGAARALGPIGIAAGIGAMAIGSMRDELESATGQSVTFMETFSGAMKVIGSDISSVLGPTIDTIGTGLSYALSKLGPAAVDIAELIINSFRAAYVDIQLLWSQFPNMIGATIVGAANTVIETMTSMVQRSVDIIDTFHGELNRFLPGRMQIPIMGDLGLKDLLLQNDYLERLKEGVEDRNKKIDEIMTSTPLRDYKDSVRDRVAGNIRDEAAAPDISIVPIPTRKPSILGFGDTKETKDADRLKETYDRMIRSANDRIEQMRAETAMLGKTGVEVDAYRFQLELLQRVEQRGTAATPAQRAEIERLGQAYKVAATEAANLKLAADLKFETEQEYRNKTDQDIASRQRGAGLSVDLTSEFANSVRELERIKQARSDLGGFFTDFRNGLMEGSTLGDAFGTAFLNWAMKAVNRITDSAIDSLVTSIIGKPGGTGGGTGLFSLIGGAASNSVTSGASKSAAGASIASTVAAAANDNAVKSAAGSALSFVGNYKSGVDAKLTDILNTAAQRFPGFKVDAMSGFRPGDPRFHGQGLATDVKLTDLSSGKMLGNYQDASSFRTYEQFAQTARGVQMAKYPELAQDFRWGGYFGGGKGKYGAVDSMHFDLAGRRVGMGGGSWEGGLNSSQRALWPGAQSQGISTDTAAAAVERMAANTNEAATNLGGLTSATTTAMQGVGSFGAGLGQFSQQLMAAASGANSPSSLLGSLGGLLGGISPTSSLWSPNTTLGGFLMNGKAGGGYTGPGGINEPAGVVHKGEIVWSQMDIARAGGIGAVEGMRLGWGGYAVGGLVGGPAMTPQRRSTIRESANSNGGSRSGDRVKVEVVTRMDKDGNLRTFVENVSYEQGQRAAGEAVDDYDRMMPDRIDEHNRNPYNRAAR